MSGALEDYQCQECGVTYKRMKRRGGRKYCYECSKAVQARQNAEHYERRKLATPQARLECWQCGPCIKAGPRWFCSTECEQQYERYQQHCEAAGGFLAYVGTDRRKVASLVETVAHVGEVQL